MVSKSIGKHNQYIQKLSSCKTEFVCKSIFEAIMRDSEINYKSNKILNKNKQISQMSNKILFRISK